MLQKNLPLRMSSQNSRRSAAASSAGRSSPPSPGATSTSSDSEFCEQAFLSAVAGDPSGRLRTFDDFSGLVQQSGRNPTQRALKAYWEKYNSRKTGVDLQGFLDICRQEPVTSREDLLDAFRAVDLNSDGFLTVDEFVKMLSSGGEVISKLEARAILQQYDRNGDGKLDYEEFINFVLGDIEKSRQSLRGRFSGGGSGAKKQPAGRDRNRDKDPNQDLDRNRDRERDPDSVSPRPAPRRAGKAAAGNAAGADGGVRLGSGRSPRLTPLKAPADLKKWKHRRVTGFFLLDESGGRRRVVSSHFNLSLPSNSYVYITMQPMTQEKLQTMKSECDLGFALFKSGKPVAICEAPVGSATSAVVGLKADLDAGEYQLLPFCCGDKLSLEPAGGARKTKPVTRQEKGGGHKITTAARAALEDIFRLCDTDQNGALDKDEFQVYNYITSDEEVTDELWDALRSMVKLKNDTLDFEAFVELNRQELEGDNWSEENFWINLRSFGVNQDLLMTSAFAYELDIHCSECPSFELVGQNPLKFPDAALSKGLADYVKEKGSSVRLNECTVFWLETPLRVYLAGEKEGPAVPTGLSLDASGSYGIESSEAVKTVYVKRSNAMLQQLVPSTPTYTFAALLKPV